MEIKEVPISQEHNKKKKFSSKIREETQRYLSERGIGKDNLSRKQWEYVAGYIKGKHYAKWGLGAMILATIISMCMAFSSYKLFKSQATRLENIMPAETVIILKDGTRKVIELDREIVETYGKIHALMGFTIGFFIFLSISTFSFVVRFLVQMHMRDDILDAFLPAAKGRSRAEVKGAIE